jgi:hypothetical protein
MLSTKLEYLCKELEYFLQGWSGFYRFAIPLYGAEMLSTGLICFLEVWNTFDRVGIPV